MLIIIIIIFIASIVLFIVDSKLEQKKLNTKTEYTYTEAAIKDCFKNKLTYFAEFEVDNQKIFVETITYDSTIKENRNIMFEIISI